jgi:Holliday junction resolvasome RuvABC DNA-binding subunit
VAALAQLGTRPAVAAAAVARAAKILGEDAPSEDLVREALKHR